WALLIPSISMHSSANIPEQAPERIGAGVINFDFRHSAFDLFICQLHLVAYFCTLQEPNETIPAPIRKIGHAVHLCACPPVGLGDGRIPPLIPGDAAGAAHRRCGYPAHTILLPD